MSKKNLDDGDAKKLTIEVAACCIACCLLGYFFGSLLAKMSEPKVDNDLETVRNITTITDRDVIAELNEKIDDYESTGGQFSTIHSLRPFAVSQLTPERRMSMVFHTFRNEELKDFVITADNYDVEGRTATIPLGEVSERFQSLFGYAPTENDLVDTGFGCGSTIFAGISYDKSAKEYKVTGLPGGCGGATNESVDSYRDSYETDGVHAFVTVEIGRRLFTEWGIYEYYDFVYNGRDNVLPITDENYDFVNSETKNEFAKYQYVFDLQEDGKWALRGMYPMDWDK